MLETFLTITLYLIWVVMAGSVWLLVCNYFTSKQRTFVIDDAWVDPKVFLRYREISYDQHLFRLMTFRWNWRSWYYESK
jgi:hypothetical protein